MSRPGFKRAAGMMVAALVTVAMGLPAAASAQNQIAGAWDQSMSLEARNDLRGAERVLIDAYGATPESYEVSLRLAWLSLRLKDANAAVTRYRRARTLPGATSEASQGLVSALTMGGYQGLERGDMRKARQWFAEALTLDPKATEAARGLDIIGAVSALAPEVWLGALGETLDSATAEVFYVQVPYRVTDQLAIRAAYRRIGGVNTPAAATTTPFFGTQDEVYGGVTVDRGVTATEVVGLALRGPNGTTSGAAASVRAGGHYGVTATLAALHSAAGWNAQVMPLFFMWPTGWTGLAAGVRYTHDPELTGRSIVFGTTIRRAAAEVDVLAHAGTERWAFNMAGPTILSFADRTNYGATITVSVNITRRLVASGQAQIEHLPAGTSTAAARYTSLAAGLRWTIVRTKENSR